VGLEPDAERLQVALAPLGEQAGDEAGVEAAREQHADGHVRDLATLDRDPQRPQDRAVQSRASMSGRGGSAS
jgi:hypothetical protein